MIALRILLGVLKGAIVGGLLGGVLWFLETGGNLQDNEVTEYAWLRWPLYGAIGLFAGIASGRPPWAKDNVKGAAWVSSLAKGIMGFILCVVLYFLGDWLLNFDLFGRVPTKWYFGFGAALGILYAVFVEIDDSVGRKGDEDENKPKSEETKAITPSS